jgi:hypothetical protein
VDPTLEAPDLAFDRFDPLDDMGWIDDVVARRSHRGSGVRWIAF